MFETHSVQLRPTRSRGLARAILTLAVAVALLAVVVLRVSQRRLDLIQQFDVASYPAESTRNSGQPWTVGQPYLLRVATREAGYVMIVHVGSDGLVSLLHPQHRWAPLAADVEVWLPAPEQGMAWSFQGDPGPQLFIAASSQNPSADPLELVREIGQTCDGLRDRRDRADCIEEALRRRLGPTHTLTVDLQASR